MARTSSCAPAWAAGHGRTAGQEDALLITIQHPNTQWVLASLCRHHVPRQHPAACTPWRQRRRSGETQLCSWLADLAWEVPQWLGARSPWLSQGLVKSFANDRVHLGEPGHQGSPR